MHEAGACDLRQRLTNDPLEPETVDVAHGVDGDAGLRDQLRLRGVERADTDERDAIRCNRGKPPSLALELRPREPERRGEGHPMDVSPR